MNNDKKNKNKPMNSVSSSFGSDISKIGTRSAQATVGNEADKKRLREAEEQLLGSSDSDPGLEQRIIELQAQGDFEQADKLLPVAVRFRKKHETLTNRTEQHSALRRERTINTTESLINRTFSSSHINGQVLTQARSAETSDIVRATQGMSQSDIDKERQYISGRIGALKGQALNISQNSLYDQDLQQNPKALAGLNSIGAVQEKLVKRLSVLSGVENLNKKLGDDPISQLVREQKALDRSESFLEKKDIQSQVKGGYGLGAMSRADLEKQQLDQNKAVIAAADAMERLAKAGGAASKEMEELKAQAKDASDGLRQTDEALRQRSGDDSGSKRSKTFSSAASVAGAIGQILSAASTTTFDVGVSQRLAVASNATGAANMANSLYGIRNSAISGNMTDLLTATGNIGGRMDQFGGELTKTGQAVSMMNVAGSAAETAAGGLMLVGSVGAGATGIGAGVGAVGGIVGAGLMANGIGNIVSTVASSSRGIAGNQAGNAARAAALAQTQAINAVSGDFLQHTFDYAMGTRQAALAAGGERGKSIWTNFSSDESGTDGLVNPNIPLMQQGANPLMKRGTGLLSKLEQARISPEEYNRMQTQGFGQQGSVYDDSQIFLANNLERSGTVSKEVGSQMMSQLAQAGSNNPTAALGSVMEAAFSKGLSGSKELQLVASNTAQMVQSSFATQALGIDTTAQASNRLTAFVNPENGNQPAAIERAKNIMQQIENQNRGVGANFTDMTGIAQISEATGLSGRAGLAFKNTSADDLNKLRKLSQNFSANEKTMSPEDRAKALNDIRQLGGGRFINEDDQTLNNKKLEAGVKTAQLSFLNSGAMITGRSNVKGVNEFYKGELSYEEILKNPQKYKGAVTEITERGKLSNSGTMYEQAASINVALGRDAPTPQGVDLANKATSGKFASEAAEKAYKASTAGAADAARKTIEGGAAGGSVDKTFGLLADRMEALVGTLNSSTGKDFQEAAGKAASDFSSGANTFLKAVGEFNKNFPNLIKAAPTAEEKAASDSKQFLQLQENSQRVNGQQKI